jgi:hypothetical protein
VHYTTGCITESNAAEDGQNNCPKHVELIGIINKQLLLHVVGCLLYCFYCYGNDMENNEMDSYKISQKKTLRKCMWDNNFRRVFSYQNVREEAEFVRLRLEGRSGL